METMSECLMRQFYKSVQELNGGINVSYSYVEETLHKLVINNFIQINRSISLEDATQVLGLEAISANHIMTELQILGVIERDELVTESSERFIPTSKFNDHVSETKDSQLEVLKSRYSKLHPDEYEELETIIRDILLALGVENYVSIE